MKRRHFVAAGTGTVLGASAYGLIGHSPSYRNDQPSGWANGEPGASNENSGKIDINHRFWAPFMGPVSEYSSQWTPELALDWMNSQGIAHSVLSPPALLMNGLSSTAALELAMRCNDYAAALCKRYPKKFSFLATLPLAQIENSIVEFERATNDLGAVGVMLPGNMSGSMLGDDRYLPLLDQLDESSANVLVLPNENPDTVNLQLDLPSHLVEDASDITRTAASLILNHRLESYPGIRWILGEAGGFLPYVAWRLSLANTMPQLSSEAPQGVLHYIRRFWFETSLSDDPVTHAVLRELVEPEKVLFGSGGPRRPLAKDKPSGLDLWPSRFHAGIGRQHALSLFPELAAPSDSPPPVPEYSAQSVTSTIFWSATQPIKHFVQRSRN